MDLFGATGIKCCMKFFWEQFSPVWCPMQSLSGNGQNFEARIPAPGGEE